MRQILLLVALCATTILMAQTTIDFTGFTGSGLESSPSGMAVLANGKLNANIVSFEGVQASSLARGVTTGGVTSGGVYALDRGAGNMALLIQPSGSEFTPGSVTFIFINNSTEVISNPSVGQQIVVINDQDRSTTVTVAASTDGTNFTNLLGNPVVVTDAARDERPANDVRGRSVNFGGASIAPGERVYVRYTLTDSGGSGFRDEIAFDDIFVAGLEPLPVSLTSLTANAKTKSVLVEWTTANETENDFFAVERSANGLEFAEIGRVRGKGNTTEASDYVFSDERPLAGTSYYRLRQVDFSGAATTSDFVVVEREAGLPVAFPNPVADRLFVRGDDLLAAEILDTNGRHVQRVAGLAGGIDVSHLRAGAYLLRLTTAAGTETLRFVRK